MKRFNEYLENVRDIRNQNESKNIDDEIQKIGEKKSKIKSEMKGLKKESEEYQKLKSEYDQLTDLITSILQKGQSSYINILKGKKE
jgi:predicted  nucleic acid-binding Zn-ribbon protein